MNHSARQLNYCKQAETLPLWPVAGFAANHNTNADGKRARKKKKKTNPKTKQNKEKKPITAHLLANFLFVTACKEVKRTWHAALVGGRGTGRRKNKDRDREVAFFLSGIQYRRDFRYRSGKLMKIPLCGVWFSITLGPVPETGAAAISLALISGG